jgi:hypothetical protein
VRVASPRVARRGRFARQRRLNNSRVTASQRRDALLSNTESMNTPYRQPNMLRPPLVALLLALSMMLAACGGKQRVVEGGEDLLTGGPELAMMGEAEERARNLLIDVTLVLQSNTDNPESAVERIRAFLTVNQPSILSAAAEMEANFAALSPVDARLYEAQLSAYFDDVHSDWRDAISAFDQAHPGRGREVNELLARVDDVPAR